jgi:acyl-CoA thioesterase-1
MIFVLGIFGCQSEDSQLLAIGDSMLAWHLEDGVSIPEVVGEQLGLSTENASISGAYLSSGGDSDIPLQYEAGDWSWVIVNGGGNDLTDECACGDCDEVLDGILSEDGDEGTLFDLVSQIVDDGSRVALVSYFEMPEEAGEGFYECNDELAELVLRSTSMSEQFSDVIFFDSRSVVSVEDTPDAYDEDFVHPSVVGAELVGSGLAEMMSEAFE